MIKILILFCESVTKTYGPIDQYMRLLTYKFKV